jgi:hypothetical protein
MAASAAPADFGVRLGPAEEGRRALSPLLAAVRSSDARWDALERFAKAWETRLEARRAATCVFLEFDDRADGRIPVPSVFAAIASGASWEPVLDLVAGGPAGAETRVRLAESVRALPRGARLLQVGAMVGRPGCARRLFVAVPKRRVRSYLECVGYPGDVEPVLELHESHAGWCGSVLLQLDVGDTIAPRLGIEFDAQAPTPALRHAEWTELLGRFVVSGLCAPERAAELLAWSRPARADRLRRDISHLKLVYDGTAPVEAKAYVFEERRGMER